MRIFSRVIRFKPGWEHLAIALVMAGVIWTNLHYKFWKDPGRIIVHDVILYYQYLPAVFIYDDIALGFIEQDPVFFQDKVWGIKTEKGRYASKMTLGLSVMYTPFFLVAHAMAPGLGYPADGYSPPYRFALILSSITALFVGLIILARLLRRYFGRKETALTLLAIGLGTNLYFYTTLEPPMSHSFSFLLFAAFLLAVDSWIRRPSWGNTILAGVVAGLIFLVRPSNGLIVIIIPLWQVASKDDLVSRLRFLLRQSGKVMMMALLAILLFLPQIIYWKYITGSFFFYGYGDEKFFFDDPEIIKGLISYRKGWLVYTPVMVFSMIGFFALYRRKRGLFYPVFVFMLLNMYIIWSWWCWWYGGGFGQRAMIESYALLSIPFAAFIQYVFEKKLFARIIFVVVIVALMSLNIYQTRQYYKGVIHWDGMTRKAYWNTYFRMKPAPGFYDQIKSPDYSEALRGNR